MFFAFPELPVPVTSPSNYEEEREKRRQGNRNWESRAREESTFLLPAVFLHLMSSFLFSIPSFSFQKGLKQDETGEMREQDMVGRKRARERERETENRCGRTTLTATTIWTTTKSTRKSTEFTGFPTMKHERSRNLTKQAPKPCFPVL